MTSYIENEAEAIFDFDIKEVADLVINKVLETEGCPFETQINILITDNEGIKGYNSEFRGIDRETDVLSFPNLFFEEPGCFDDVEEGSPDYFDPESGELVLGDIILSKDRIYEQAESFGHSVKREYAFLVAHSMLHLCGYDHMEPEDAAVMEKKQEEVMTAIGITRED